MSCLPHACDSVNSGEEEDGADGGGEVGAGPPLHNSGLCSTRHTLCVHRYKCMYSTMMYICRHKDGDANRYKNCMCV